jgi:hypothetical protein
MASCEKCWGDAYVKSLYTGYSQAECYNKLLKERENNPCTPEEQAGEDATICPKCGRKTIHQYAKVCMNSECN